MAPVGFKARNHPQQVDARGPCDDTDDRRTPDNIFLPLHAEHRFTLDVAANPVNAKVPRYFTRDTDGLKHSWKGEVVWCNPPYSDLYPWVEKALAETAHGGCPKVVMLLPNSRCEQDWWCDLIEPVRDRGGSVRTEFLRCRRRFGWGPGRKPRKPESVKKGDRPPFGLIVVTFTGGAP